MLPFRKDLGWASNLLSRIQGKKLESTLKFRGGVEISCQPFNATDH